MDILLTAFFAVLGALLASFLTLVAERTAAGKAWVSGRSACGACGKALAPLELIPVFSWLVLRGKCSACRAPIPALYPAIEATLALLFALSYQALSLSLALIPFLAALAALVLIVVSDLAHTIVPRGSALFLALCAFAFALLSAGSPPELGLTFLSAGLIGLAFLAFHVASRGRAMGLGDAPVALALALLVGYQAALPGLLFSFWIGAAVGIVILVSRPRGHRMGIEVPFVPFLAAGFLLAYFTSWNPLALF